MNIAQQDRPGRGQRWAAASGIVAAGFAAGAGELLAGIVSPSVSPVTAVGGAVIDAVPGPVKDWAISLFGTGDKAALLVGMGLVMAAVAASAGVLEYRRRFVGFAIFAAMGLIGFFSVLTRAQMTVGATFVPLMAAAVGIAILRMLLLLLKKKEADAAAPARAADAQVAVDAVRPPASRRRFLQAFWITTAVTAVGGTFAALWRGASAAVAERRAGITLPVPASPAPAIPTGAALTVPGITPLVVPNDDFYRIDTALSVPALDPETWRLRVTGMVEREVEVDLATILAKPLLERHVTIACVSNNVGGDLIGNAKWLGWPIRELLAEAGPLDGADMVLSRSSDGWTAGTPLSSLTDDRDALLAVGMNGEPLPLEHGFPARLIVPGLFGYVSATKWVVELKVTRFSDDVAYWTTRGWSERGPVKLSSRIDVPALRKSVSAGTVAVAGVAWSQHTGVSAVDVRINRGDWQPAELAPAISKDTWVQWQASLDLSPGSYELQVRATDRNGVQQVEETAPVVPDGSTGFHTITVDVQQ